MVNPATVNVTSFVTAPALPAPTAAALMFVDSRIVYVPGLAVTVPVIWPFDELTARPSVLKAATAGDTTLALKVEAAPSLEVIV